MQKKDYLVFLILGLISLAFFFYPPNISFKIDDFVSKVFYSLNQNKLKAEEIAVIYIDDDSIRQINDQWPFRRALYAEALEVLAEEKSKVVSFDLVFTGEGFSKDDDDLFVEAIDKFEGKVILAYFLDKDGRPIYPKKAFIEKAIIAFHNVPADKDRVIRQSRGYYEHAGLADYSWTIKTASAFYAVTPKIKDGYIRVGERKIPVNKKGAININYLNKPKDIARISFNNLLMRNFEKGIFHNKIVLISPTMKIIHDIHNTPLGYMPGIFVNANIIANILKDKFLISTPLSANLIILILVLAITSCLVTGFSFIRRIFLSIGVLLVLFWINIGLKYSGWQMGYGKIVVSALTFLIMGNFYAYISFLMHISRIKNRMFTDPLSNLYNLRYFFERLSFEQKSVGRKKSYLAVVKLEDINFLFKGESFEKVKTIYRLMSAYLYSISNLWAKYNQEVIIGRLNKKKNAERVKEKIEKIAEEQELKIKVKLGIAELAPNLDKRKLIPLLLEKINALNERILYVNDNEFPLAAQRKDGPEDFLSSLYEDTEERNRELLSTIRRLKKEEKKTKQAYLELMSSLINALESKDAYTQGHTASVCKYSLMIADKLNLSEEEKEKIRKGALLHDLGKIGIPDAILHKKGPLTRKEFAVMKQHEEMSAKILTPISEFEDILPYVLQHHENYDGTGYPQGLSDNNISLGARIIAVADAFDALTTKRDYKKAFSVEMAVAELKKMRGSKLDPLLVNKFLDMLEEPGIIK